MLMRLEKPQDVQWLLGDPLSLDEAPEIPFHPLRLQFAADLSKALMADPQTRSMPDVATFAFWCRRANLEKAAAAQDVGVGVRLGLGLVFHISPSNVPINFAYSLIFALLAGNSSVLRLSSKESAQEQVVLSALRELLQQTPYTSLRGCLLVMRYERNDEITEYWLQRALGRIVWGGDTTVAHLRSLQCHPRSREVAFADRYSMGVVSAEALVALDDAALQRLCGDLFNDIYLMHQNACSSPHLLVWVGPDEVVQAAQRRLWPRFEQWVDAHYRMAPVQAMDKFVGLCNDVLNHDNVARVEWPAAGLARLQLTGTLTEQWRQRGGFGTVHEWTVANLDAIAPAVDPHFQTMTSFGFTSAQLKDFVIRNRLSGVDRIVPIGRALDMGLIWDGFDIISCLSRVVDIQA